MKEGPQFLKFAAAAARGSKISTGGLFQPSFQRGGGMWGGVYNEKERGLKKGLLEEPGGVMHNISWYWHVCAHQVYHRCPRRNKKHNSLEAGFRTNLRCIQGNRAKKSIRCSPPKATRRKGGKGRLNGGKLRIRT